MPEMLLWLSWNHSNKKISRKSLTRLMENQLSLDILTHLSMSSFQLVKLKSLKSLRNVVSLPRDSPRSLLPSTSSTQCAVSEVAESVLNSHPSCKCKPEPS